MMMKSSLVLAALALAVSTVSARELRGVPEQQSAVVVSSEPSASEGSSDLNDEFADVESKSSRNNGSKRRNNVDKAINNRRNNVDDAIDRRRDNVDDAIGRRGNNVDRAIDRRRDNVDKAIDRRRDNVDRAIDNSRNRRDDRIDDRIDGGGKRSAAQKRQGQRDDARADKNPNRDQRSEERERIRKNEQSRSRGDPCVDPSSVTCHKGNKNYPNGREKKRVARCTAKDESCNYHRVAPGLEPNTGRAARDVRCIKDCKESRADTETCVRTICAMTAQE